MNDDNFWGGDGSRTQLPPYQTPRLKAYLKAEAWEIVAKLEPGSHVLEVGCGVGRFIEELLSNGLDLDIVGIDCLENLVESTTEKFRGLVKIKLSEADNLLFEDAMFDAVFLVFNTLGTMQEPLDKNALDEAGRVLKPGGRLFVSVFKDCPETKEAQEELYAHAEQKICKHEPDRVHFNGAISRRFTEDKLRQFWNDKPEFTVSVKEITPIALLLEAHKRTEIQS